VGKTLAFADHASRKAGSLYRASALYKEVLARVGEN